MKKIFLKLMYAFVFFAFVSVHAQRGIGTNNPNSSAVLELKSSTKGFLPPRLSMSEAILIGTPAEGLTFYCTDCDVKGLFFYNGSSFVGVVDGSGLTNTVTGQNGTVWMDRNLGASRVATAFNDAASYGDYYQWGTAFPEWNSGGGSTDDTAWDGSSKGLQDPCPDGFRIPTITELENEVASFGSSTNRLIAAYQSPLKLPAPGYRLNTANGILKLAGSQFFIGLVMRQMTLIREP